MKEENFEKSTERLAEEHFGREASNIDISIENHELIYRAGRNSAKEYYEAIVAELKQEIAGGSWAFVKQIEELDEQLKAMANNYESQGLKLIALQKSHDAMREAFEDAIYNWEEAQDCQCCANNASIKKCLEMAAADGNGMGDKE